MPKLLTQKQIEKNLTDLSPWVLNKKGTEIKKTFKTKSFIGGLSFIAKVAVHAELLDHHPSIELEYQTVTVKLSTHDAGGLTKLDFDLAKRIDALSVK
jgi:4a-hydroxytetrahydrobiopterin dehydratase